jgi:histidine triad (HIT) family protein
MCIFCRIINKEIPSSILYEDERTLAILDISQVTKGHTLILPKVHYDDFRASPDEVLADCTAIAKIVARRIDAAFFPAGFNLLTNCGEAAGQSVQHLHFHLIPRYDESDGLTLRFKGAKDPDLATIARHINEKK